MSVGGERTQALCARVLSLSKKYTIRLIRELGAEIEEIETQIKAIMDELQSPIPTIQGIDFRIFSHSYVHLQHH